MPREPPGVGGVERVEGGGGNRGGPLRPGTEAVVAVPDAYTAILCLQRIASDTAGRGYRMATAAL